MAKRIIPVTMATQHPDNSSAPFWAKKPFISASDEIYESFICFSKLGIDEYNWDWEGKFVDEAVVDRLLHKHIEYFRENKLGIRKFLTFRIPNPRVEKQFRLARAFMVIITSSQLSASLGFEDPPIFETILPLTENAEEIVDIQEAFKSLVKLEHRLLKMDESLKHIEVIPLFEQVDTIVNSDMLLKAYIKRHRKIFGFKPEYIRPYCARSDPALNSGLFSTMLAVKTAISNYQKLEKETGVRLYPMLGTGALPFRGGLSPERTPLAASEYSGFRTLTVQSAFRYDYPKTEVLKALKQLQKLLPGSKPRIIEEGLLPAVKKGIRIFEKHYRETIELLSPMINAVSSEVERRRERVQHVGLFGYSRGVGNIRLPRAIPFTAALYSIGLPPEIIGTGRGIKEAKKMGIWKDIKDIYTNLFTDISFAAGFVNMENIEKLKKIMPGTETLLDDIKILSGELGIEFKPVTKDNIGHYNLSSKIYNNWRDHKNISGLITKSGILRKSLG